MFEKTAKKGSYRFCLQAPANGSKVSVAGDFSAWQPLPMRKQKNGSFASVVTLKPGTYEYKFIVNGEWLVDGDNSAYALNPYGTANSVAVAE